MSFILDWRESFQFSSLSRQEFSWSNSRSRASYSETENFLIQWVHYELYSTTRQICTCFLPGMCCSSTTPVGLCFLVCIWEFQFSFILAFWTLQHHVIDILRRFGEDEYLLATKSIIFLIPKIFSGFPKFTASISNSNRKLTGIKLTKTGGSWFKTNIFFVSSRLASLALQKKLWKRTTKKKHGALWNLQWKFYVTNSFLRTACHPHLVSCQWVNRMALCI